MIFKFRNHACAVCLLVEMSTFRSLSCHSCLILKKQLQIQKRCQCKQQVDKVMPIKKLFKVLNPSPAAALRAQLLKCVSNSAQLSNGVAKNVRNCICFEADPKFATSVEC